MKTMGKRIHEMRTKKGMSQEELGEKLGVLRQTIGKWENGDVANIKRSAIAKMAELFNCDPVWLMGYDGAQTVNLTYSADGHETVTTEVDATPIIGESSLRVKILQEAAKVRQENLQAAIDILKSLQ